MAELGLARAAALASLCLGTVLSALVYPLFLVAMLLALHDGRLLTPTDAMEAFVTSLALTTFGIGLFAIFAPAIVGALRRRQWRQLWLLPLLPVYVLMVSLAAWRGLIDWIVAPHHWLKTDHGLARTSLHARPEVSATRATPSPLRPAVGQG